MNIGKACAIFEQIGSDKYTDAEKLQAVREVVEMPTHNGITKATMLAVLRWFAENVESAANDPCWIPVTPETMPKNMTKVITYDGTHNIVSTHVYDGEGFRAVRRADGTWAHDCCITRWMPLPDAPEVSENAP